MEDTSSDKTPLISTEDNSGGEQQLSCEVGQHDGDDITHATVPSNNYENMDNARPVDPTGKIYDEQQKVHTSSDKGHTSSGNYEGTPSSNMVNNGDSVKQIDKHDEHVCDDAESGGDVSDGCSEESLLECQDEHCTSARSNEHEVKQQGDKDKSMDNNTESSQDINTSGADYFCTSCDMLLCSTCQYKFHSDHELALISEARQVKEKYIDELLSGVNKNITKCQTQKLQLENLLGFLSNSVKDLMLKIESRAAKLCEQIQKRKQHLLDELRALKKYQYSQYENQLELVQSLHKDLAEASDFATVLLSHGEDSDVLTIGREVTDNLHKLMKNRGLNGVNIATIKLDINDPHHDDVHVDKLFGSLVQGVVRCGEAEKVASYNIDLPWPTGMAITKNHDFVVTGKTGALDKQGKVMFVSKHGRLTNVDELEENCIPYGASCDQKTGDVLVTDSKNQIIQYSPLGRKREIMKDKFKGTGRAVMVPSSGHLLVTSSDEKQVLLYDKEGRKYIIPTDGTQLDHPHYISTNEQAHIIVSDFNLNAAFVFDSGGKLMFKYLGNGAEGGQLKCPSAVCCDSFGNILVADFMNDRVHLLSKTGEFLGFLLTKENGITCPNFMTLDHENNLYVGQYGGEISVFRYLSFVKYI